MYTADITNFLDQDGYVNPGSEVIGNKLPLHDHPSEGNRGCNITVEDSTEVEEVARDILRRSEESVGQIQFLHEQSGDLRSDKFYENKVMRVFSESLTRHILNLKFSNFTSFPETEEAYLSELVERGEHNCFTIGLYGAAVGEKAYEISPEVNKQIGFTGVINMSSYVEDEEESHHAWTEITDGDTRFVVDPALGYWGEPGVEPEPDLTGIFPPETADPWNYMPKMGMDPDILES
ncbi:MAG: hypothetical protein ABEJ03_03125 [Candidatus Nanohaloarchaea archaeon]